jgi:thiamine-monophosphate kinase
MGGVSAMMDDSDGIALSLFDLASVNDCGFSLDSVKLPRLAWIPEDQAGELALFGGGDYELIFTLPPGRHPVEGVSYTIIGTTIEENSVLIDGLPLEKRGYQHHW